MFCGNQYFVVYVKIVFENHVFQLIDSATFITQKLPESTSDLHLKKIHGVPPPDSPPLIPPLDSDQPAQRALGVASQHKYNFSFFSSPLSSP